MTVSHRLWLAPGERERLRSQVAAGEPTLVAIRDLARRQADFDPARELVQPPVGQAAEPTTVPVVDRINGCAIVALLDGDAGAAQRGAAAFLWWTREWTNSDLSTAHQALVGAVLWDCAADAWSTEVRRAMTERLVQIHGTMREINKGNPHNVTNNWWAVTHSGALFAARAVHGEPGVDLAEGIAWATGRLEAFADHFGSGGLYHEGLGYQGYTCCFLLPALLLGGREPLPWQREAFATMSASYYSAAVAAPAVSDSPKPAQGTGLLLSWNDAGLTWPEGNIVACLLRFAPDGQRGALRWCFDRLNGIHGSRTYAPGFAGLFFTVLCYPSDHPACPPTGILPNHVRDPRQGLIVHRNRWQGADDGVLGLYAKSTWVGGHGQQDAGSIRLIALGHPWIVGGGQARGDRSFQSVVHPISGPGEPAACGAVMWDEARPGGSCTGMDLRRVSVGYHERYVAADWATHGDAPVTLALLDQVDDHAGRDWLWTLVTLPHFTVTLHDDGAGFTIRAADGAQLDGRFLTARPRLLEIRRTPDSTRTYSGGNRETYPGRPYVAAEFAHQPHLAIYVAITVHRGSARSPTLGDGLDLHWGQRTWKRPFGAAIPVAFRPGISSGLCQAPAGVPDYRARPR